MKRPNVMKTRRLNLCVSCEACLAICPQSAVEMEFRFGQFLPKVDDIKCAHCGLCLDVCPSIDVDPFNLCFKKELTEEDLDGSSLECYIAYSKDISIRKNATSGGVITTLIAKLIKKKEYDRAFVLPFDTFTGKPVRLESTANIQKIIRSAKSKYIPASIYNIITTLSKADDKKYIIVGTPCQILGIKKYLKQKNINEKNVLFLGLFCDKTLSFNFIKFIKDIYSEKNEKLVRFEYRSKEKGGWPGHSKACFNSGREFTIDRNVRMRVKPYFQLERCIFCTDKLNRLADISFGDCYIKGEEDFYGKSSIIVRTEKGRQILKRYSYLFDLKEASIDEIRKSQRLMSKKTNVEYSKIFIKNNDLRNHPKFNIDRKRAVKLCMLRKRIHWGKNYQLNMIKLSSLFFKVGEYAKKALRYATACFHIGCLVLKDFFSLSSVKVDMLDKSARKNVIIMGGQFFNKGAQAMSFTAIDHIRRKFPQKDIYLFSEVGDYRRPREEKANYSFKILPWSLSIKYRILTDHSFQNETYYEPVSERDIDHIKRILKNSYFVTDVSGYRLTSEFGFFTSLSYLLDIMIARRFSVPYYILPQSIGPFNYHPLLKLVLIPMMRLYLKYPRKIYLREEDSFVNLQKFRKDAEKRYDIVLGGERYYLKNIYKNPPCLTDVKIERNSVGIIPNLRVFERANETELYIVYKTLIEKLIEKNRTVYLLRYSYKDLVLIDRIRNMFPTDSHVKVIENDLNAIELENVIKQFNFVIASRYHSIIHAYKNGVPALVIGWAAKYYELLRDFDQLDYFFDIRYKMEADKIVKALLKMLETWQNEKVKIKTKMNEISSENIFNTLPRVPL